MAKSDNAVVNAALAWKEKTATNAKPDILDYVKKAPYAESVSRDGYTVMYTSNMMSESKAEQVYREVERYLAKRVKVGLCRFVNIPLAPVVPYGKSGGGEKSFRLSVSIPDLAVVNSSVAANAGRKTVKVELETVSFEKGVRPETRYMSVEEVRDLLKRLGKSGDADSFVSRLERQGATDIAINEPDLHAALI